MIFELTVKNPAGLHFRPCGYIVGVVSTLNANGEAILGRKRADIRSISGLVLLGAKYKDIVKFKIDGPDAKKAADKIAFFFYSEILGGIINE